VSGTLAVIAYLIYRPFVYEAGSFVWGSQANSLRYFVSVLMIMVLVVVSLYDIEHYLIPDVIILPASVVLLILRMVLPIWQFVPGVLGAAAMVGFIGLLVVITKGSGMGEGDVKLALLLGLLVGWPYAWIALLASFVIGATVGGGLVLLGKKGLKDMVPFGPFLAIGGLLAWWFGESILIWYQHTFLITW
jgi:leader peptidase (prepilin peptidase)/N-methyltransferase